jgi:mono/diheme cytochrome c family protein
MRKPVVIGLIVGVVALAFSAMLLGGQGEKGKAMGPGMGMGGGTRGEMPHGEMKQGKMPHGQMEQGGGDVHQAERPEQGDPEEGKEIYQRFCSSCHGASGRGDGIIGRQLTPKPADFTKHARGHDDEYFFKAIEKGGPAVGKSPLMPAWGSQLKPKEIWDVVSYIWTLVQGAGEPADKGDMPRMQSPGGGR